MKTEYKSVAKMETRFTTDDRITITTERFNSRDIEVKFNNLVETMSSELMVAMLGYRLVLHDLTRENPFRKPDAETAALLTPAYRREVIAVLNEKINSFNLLSPYRTDEKRILDVLEGFDYGNEPVEENLKIGRVEGSDFVNVEFVSENPLLSAYVVNTLSEESIRYDNFLNSKRSTQSIQFFANLLDEKRKVLEERTNELDKFKQTVKSFSQPGAASNGTAEIDLEEKRSTLLSNIHRLRLSIESINRRLGNGQTPQQQNEISANIINLKNQINQLNANSNLQDEARQEKLDDLTDQLQVELSLLEEIRTPGKTRAELRLEKEESEIELRVAQADLTAVNNLMATLRKNVSKESTLDELQKRVDKASEEYLDILDRYNVEKSKALISSPLQLAIRGQPNDEPEFPKRYLVVALTWLTTLMICAFVIIVKELTDPRIRNAEQFTLISGLAVSATVRNVNVKRLNLNDLFFQQNRKDLDAFKNHLRKLRYEIEESGGRVLLITSTSAGQGKTFLILCLSYLLALLNKKVLVIDTNFRHNSITKALQRKIETDDKSTPEEKSAVNEKGICVVDQYPKAFIQSQVLTRDQLWIEAIGNSGSSMSPAEVFVEKDFKSVLNTLKEFYDYIIMEGPALNDYSDTQELANYADKVVPVFSAQSPISTSDLESIEFLKRLDGKLVGAILNNVDEA